jgi:hypothetical protein
VLAIAQSAKRARTDVERRRRMSASIGRSGEGFREKGVLGAKNLT